MIGETWIQTRGGSHEPETMPRATAIDALHEFACSILRPVTIDELRGVLPVAFGRLLDERVDCDVIVAGDGQGLPEISHRARACVPLRSQSGLVGAVVLTWAERECDPSLPEDVLRRAAQLAAMSIENRRRSDAERERARTDAADLKFDMIGMLGHEMRTPLASIKGYSSALLLDEVEWDQSILREFLQAIDEESDRLTEMVNHLLDSTVIESGVLELKCEPVLLPALARRIVEKMSHRTDRHQLIMSFSNVFPVVYADEQRVQQVLTNLLDNAIKYSPDGGLIVVSGEVLDREVLVHVSDQGVGIAPEHLNKLFERFFRTEQRRIHGVSGTGLGLPIVDAIVRAHGGRIWAESVVDEGTKLSFTLPIGGDGIGTGDDDERRR